MTNAEARLIVQYSLAAAAGILLPALIAIQSQLGSGQPIDWSPVAAAALASLITTLRAAMLSSVTTTDTDALAASIKRMTPAERAALEDMVAEVQGKG